MPMIRANGTALYYEDTGGGGMPVVFSHGLLWNSSVFAPQIAVLKDRYRCIAYDHRGQGRSADGVGHAIGMDTVTDDAAALIEKLGLGPVHFSGLSMGGIVGMRLGIGRPDLIRSLVLIATTADAEPYTLKYKALTAVSRLFGVRAVAPAVMRALYGKTTLSDPARADERREWLHQYLLNRSTIWRAANGVLERESIIGELGKITAPTLVMVGEEDISTPKAFADRIVGAIPQAKLVVIPAAGHGPPLEQPAVVTAAVGAFLDAQSGAVRSTGAAAA
jgi:3-oxoadipate enol-lactonase